MRMVGRFLGGQKRSGFVVPDTNCCDLQPYRVNFEKKLKRNFEEERRTIATEKREELRGR
jgi:hypothetical protein